MRVWLGTDTSGQKGQTRGPALTREVDVLEEEKEAVRNVWGEVDIDR
jgi:hypothetical protein